MYDKPRCATTKPNIYDNHTNYLLRQNFILRNNQIIPKTCTIN